MPVLLLCQGDKEAKDMLRAAIEARYGINPPAIESLQVDFDGRARVALGPLKTWVPVETTARFVFPTYLRWDFVVKPLNVSVQRGIEAFDGKTYRSRRGNQNTDVNIKTDIISSARSRLWAIAALLLTPMSDSYIKVTACDGNCLRAENTKLNDVVHVYLRDDATVDRVCVECLNPDIGDVQMMTLVVAPEQILVNELIMPQFIHAYWDDDSYYEVEPVHVRMNPAIKESVFSLAADT